MKQKQSNEEYITRAELESTYNYQKKVFDSKLEEVNQILDKIQECFSLRFGEELDNTRYDKELENIRESLNDIKINSNNEIKEIEKRLESIIDGKVSEIEVKNKITFEDSAEKSKSLIAKDIEKMHQEINKKINKEQNDFRDFRERKINELKQDINYIETRSRELKDSTEEYVRIFREELKEIGKDGRSRTAIAKQQKIINQLLDNREKLEEYVNDNIDEINKSINNVRADIERRVINKINELDYQEEIECLKQEIHNIEDFIQESNELNNRKIGAIKNEYVPTDNIQKIENNLKCEIEKIKEEIIILSNENKITNDSIKEQRKDVIKEIEEVSNINVEKNKNDIEKLELANQLNIETLRKDVEKLLNEQRENIIKKVEDGYNANTEKNKKDIEILRKDIENSLIENKKINDKFKEQKEAIIKEYENYYNTNTERIINDIDKLKIENNLNIEKIGKAINDINREERETKNIIDSFITIQKSNNTELNDIVQDLDEQNKHIESEIEVLKKKLSDVVTDDIYDVIENINSKMNELEKQKEQVQKKNIEVEQQLQAVLNIVVKLEDKFNKGGFETLANDVGKIMDRQVKAIQSKYDKLYEKKLKEFECKLKNGVADIKENTVETTKRRGRPKKIEKDIEEINKYNNIVTIEGVEPKKEISKNIYKEISPVQIKEAAASNMTLDERQEYLQYIIQKLKNNSNSARSQHLFNSDNEDI